MVVDPVDESRGVVFGRGGEDHAFGSRDQMRLSFFFGEEHAGGLADERSVDGSPWDVLGVFLGK